MNDIEFIKNEKKAILIELKYSDDEEGREMLADLQKLLGHKYDHWDSILKKLKVLEIYRKHTFIRTNENETICELCANAELTKEEYELVKGALKND